jgi:long-chain acyl-CoA synthetase
MLGGKLRVVSLGSARSDPAMLWFYNNVGVPVFEGYGLTESCPISSNYPGSNVIGTVGTPTPSLEVKISPDGEILVRGPNVMHGYYMDPEATKAALDEEGWLHTRDQGEFDKTGRLIFVNRFDDRTKTSYGIYVDVPKIEILLNRLPFVNFSVVIANDKPHATCLIFPNFEVIDNLKKQLNLENLADDKLLNIAFMRKTVDQAIKELNDKLDKHENILGYRFVWDRNDTGFLTQTMKIKRSYVLEKYKNLIAEMYPVKTIRL